uniref:Protein Wnt n=1 Tax=Acrobeloides nanus TaxID=290746 RepID=A0A914CUF4_9BILA
MSDCWREEEEDDESKSCRRKGCSPELMHVSTFRQFPIICREQPPTAIVAYEGILDAMEQCKEQMRFQPWDCTQSGTIIHDPTILKYGYKESAYLLAMSSAGAAWGIATACAQGWIDECRCAPRVVPNPKNPHTSDWDWGGCSDLVKYGIETSRKLLTRAGPRQFILKKIEKHNLKAGRLAVKKTSATSCKCHGVSGSCQSKVCWKKVSDLGAITKHLTDKYKKAKQVQSHSEIEKSRNSELIYLEPSPEVCSQYQYNPLHRRSLPRVCNWRNETHSLGDCDHLCCGRGYNVTHEVISYKCDCKFVWCCKLECNECLQHRWVSTCNI